jgi:hypothetical protein
LKGFHALTTFRAILKMGSYLFAQGLIELSIKKLGDPFKVFPAILMH